MQGESERESALQEVIGESPAFKGVLREAINAANGDSVLLIAGEVGTGKELVARAIHRMSKRRNQSFVKVDCSNVGPAQLESALFGPDKGRLEAANQGTLLLTHIESVSQELQPRLLRVFEQKQFKPARAKTTVKIDIRLIATTSVIGDRIEDSWLPKGLFPDFDLSIIKIPALRERRTDIPLLAWHFVRKWERLMKKPIEVISPGTMDSLTNYSWPANIRELEMVMERAVRSSKNAVLQPELPSSAD